MHMKALLTGFLEVRGKVGNTGRYCPHVSQLRLDVVPTSRERLGDLMRQVVDLKKLEY